MKVYENIFELIGNTPLLKLNKIIRDLNLECNLYAKLEGFNPGGSVKDRVALEMMQNFIANGVLKEDSIIIEPTSGNTGIGLAYVCNTLGYKVIIVMPENMSKERISLLKAYGAEVVLTDQKLGMDGAVSYVNNYIKEHPNCVLAGQFFNESNPLTHYKYTAKEIYESLDGTIDVFVTGIGTGGTISGVGRFLKKYRPNCKIIGVEPLSSPLLTKGFSGKHIIQGIGANFIPPNLEMKFVDEIITCSDIDAINTVKYLYEKEGYLAGISSGAALFVAIKEAQKPTSKNKQIVVLLPDGGSRYLSLEIFK